MTPEQLAKSGSEHAEQMALFAWAALMATREPKLKKLYAIPNGSARGDNPKSRAIRGAQLKAEGVKSGFPDIGLPVARKGFHGLYIELKKIKGGHVDKAQKEWHEDLRAEGYFVAVCLGWEDARDCLKWYLEREDI